MRHAIFIVLLAMSAAGCENVLTPSMYKRDVTAVITGPTTVAVGGSVTLTVTLHFSDGETRQTLAYIQNGVPTYNAGAEMRSSDPAVATVSDRGVVTGHSAGAVTITATPTKETTGTGKLIPGTFQMTVTR